jgi:hypothetical protein
MPVAVDVIFSIDDSVTWLKKVIECRDYAVMVQPSSRGYA